MSSDPGDLANMADLALPPMISYWPPAPGVWIVGMTLLALALLAAWRAIRRYRADAYLREASAGIDALGQAPPLERISEILKRAALVAHGRERVASLTGQGWAGFLSETAGGSTISRLVEGLRHPMGEPASGSANIASEAKLWLRAQRGRVSREA